MNSTGLLLAGDTNATKGQDSVGSPSKSTSMGRTTVMPTRNVNLTTSLTVSSLKKLRGRGIAEGNVFGRVRKAVKLPVPPR
jgi:hypothetical protein